MGGRLFVVRDYGVDGVLPFAGILENIVEFISSEAFEEPALNAVQPRPWSRVMPIRGWGERITGHCATPCDSWRQS
jgi:hypothetical protein